MTSEEIQELIKWLRAEGDNAKDWYSEYELSVDREEMDHFYNAADALEQVAREVGCPNCHYQIIRSIQSLHVCSYCNGTDKKYQIGEKK